MEHRVDDCRQHPYGRIAAVFLLCATLLGLAACGEREQVVQPQSEKRYQGKTDTQLRAAADALVTGTRTLGETGQLRSFNWQCRSAVATPYFLR